MPSSIFVRDARQYIDDLAHNFKQRMYYDNGCYSEPLMYLAVYQVCCSVLQCVLQCA